MTRPVSVVIPTLGRSSLVALLAALTLPDGSEILVVDDRSDHREPLTAPGAKVLAGAAAGPAAARNVGWRAARHDWVVFLDDDVLPDADWAVRLDADLARAGARVGGVQGRIRVPLPVGRRPSDWERVTAGLAKGAWLTADMAYRRVALEQAGGFDERFPRAFREDAELAHRVRETGWILMVGDRTVTHPVRPEGRWISVRVQRGNADDALLRRLYGRRWRDKLNVPAGRRGRHALITAAALIGVLAAAAGQRRAALVATVVWAMGTAEFATARIMPGPRDPREVGTMLATSVVIPPVAVAHWLRGWWGGR